MENERVVYSLGKVFLIYVFDMGLYLVYIKNFYRLSLKGEDDLVWNDF